jgi:hypothetical protein
MSKTNEQLAIELARVEGNEQNLSRVASAKRTVEDFLQAVEDGESPIVQDTLKALVRRDLEQINA